MSESIGMRILHIAKYDIAAGAARAANRLHQGLRRLGVESSMLVQHKLGDDATVREIDTRALWPRLLRRVRRARLASRTAALTRRPSAANTPFSLARSAVGPQVVDEIPPCDVVQLHWVGGVLDFPSFFPAVTRRTPVVWRLADESAMTGGCHYAGGCTRFETGCGACPALGSTTEHDLARVTFDEKRRALHAVPSDRLHITSPSRWLAQRASRSALLGRLPVHVIPTGLDTEVFAPRNRAAARASFGLPMNAHVVLFVAGAVDDPRKGLAQLVETLGRVRGVPGLHLLSVGRGGAPLPVNLPHTHLGFIEDDRTLSMVYSAADVFVSAALEDNLPGTVLESLSCGTPVVGFDVGGVGEMVRPGVTGALAPVRDTAALASALSNLLTDDAARHHLAERCRRIAVAEYDLLVQARCYAELYEHLTERSLSRPASPGRRAA